VPTSERVWNEVIEAGRAFGIMPCGLGARNTLRLEGALSLYGHEISDSINVWEAGLDRFCKMEKGPFLGSDALGQVLAGGGPQRRLVGLEMIERGIARDEYRVFDLSGKAIGYVTSGSPAPFLKKNIALAYVPREFAAVDAEVAVEIRNAPVKAKVVPIPFYRKPKKQPTPVEKQPVQ
jgi:aminomethyltransferase